ncbi:hypothetical protein BDK51DRAFT_50113 [Blyttiomyces helicus]|uniref:SH3 domain-containing protein n=1 Tax=Blyttiomyces helicus TaxID=388810 RepID=A0A4P9VX51_9FUNG|nr:hypothetical protein BDK51DRAFT_50113 [Blyttiomyces helicus]|eukprot:RKO83273.1 hypothetical protein BDK51DRAFT_50113 [Blyttiomyces helicus]
MGAPVTDPSASDYPRTSLPEPTKSVSESPAEEVSGGGGGGPMNFQDQLATRCRCKIISADPPITLPPASPDKANMDSPTGSMRGGAQKWGVQRGAEPEAIDKTKTEESGRGTQKWGTVKGAPAVGLEAEVVVKAAEVVPEAVVKEAEVVPEPVVKAPEPEPVVKAPEPEPVVKAPETESVKTPEPDPEPVEEAAVTPQEAEAEAEGEAEGEEIGETHLATALADFESGGEGQLTLVAGETYRVISWDYGNGWAYGMNADGTEAGVFPQTYVELIEMAE